MGEAMKELINVLQQIPLFGNSETALARAVLCAMREVYEDVVASQGHVWIYKLGAWHKLEKLARSQRIQCSRWPHVRGRYE